MAPDGGEVSVAYEGPVGEPFGVGDEVLRVSALDERPGEDPVADGVDPARRVPVLGGPGERPDLVRVEGDGELRAGRKDGAQCCGAEAVGEVEVVCGPECG